MDHITISQSSDSMISNNNNNPSSDDLINRSTLNSGSNYSHEFGSPVWLIYGYIVAIGTFFAFYGIENTLDVYRDPIESSLASKQNNKSIRRRWNWRKFNNTVISLIHATLCSIGLVISLILYPSLQNDLVFESHLIPYLVICFSTGYFVKDFLTNLLRRHEFARNWTESSEILLHHVVCVLDMSISINKRHYTGGLMFALLAELNNTFLHTRSLLLMGIGIPQDGPLFRAVSHLNLITNLIFRCLPNFFLAYRFVLGSPTGDPKLDSLVPKFDLSLITFSLLLLMVYQSVMFFRICTRDFKRSKAAKVSQSKKD
ncbi:TLC domain-containing protein 2-like [Panonychus citri]|uniref:TLC domain-containing protein 2-like n=1 Tax=Panonychus citri TaxID=50023 RepID=UPI0023073037|nr:TLC domain-containing protein 2-like [Panonychus citri]